MKRERTWTILKATLTAALIVLLIQRIGAEALEGSLRGLRPRFLMAIPIILFADTVLRTISWQTLLKARGLELGLARLLQVNMSGAFFGTFLPTSLGTDLARTTLLTTEEKVGAEESVSSILILNLFGLLALCLLSLVGIALLGNQIGNRVLVSLVGLGSVAGIAAAIVLLVGSSNGLATLPIPDPIRRFARLDSIGSAFTTYLRSSTTLVRVLGLALANQLLAVLLIYFLSESVNSGTPLLLLLVLVPATTLLRLLPLSLAGFGAEQGIFVYVFVQAGRPAADAFIISILLSISTLLLALAGGAVYGLRTVRGTRISDRRPSLARSDAEEASRG